MADVLEDQADSGVSLAQVGFERDTHGRKGPRVQLLQAQRQPAEVDQAVESSRSSTDPPHQMEAAATDKRVRG